MKNFIVWLGLALILSGCVAGQEVRVKIREGMTKEQVISAMGHPDGFQQAGDFEALVFANRLISGWFWDRADYTVILKGNSVVAYGPGQVRQESPKVLILVPIRKWPKAEKLLNEQMLAILEWAAEHPKRWHDIGKMLESQKAAELLAKRGR